MSTKGMMLSDKALWDSKPKTRSVEAAARTLEESAHMLLGQDEAADLMTQMIHLVEFAPKKNDLFIRLRRNSREFIASMGPEDVDVWAYVHGPTMEGILTTIALQLLKDLEQDPSSFLFTPGRFARCFFLGAVVIVPNHKK